MFVKSVCGSGELGKDYFTPVGSTVSLAFECDVLVPVENCSSVDLAASTVVQKTVHIETDF